MIQAEDRDTANKVDFLKNWFAVTGESAYTHRWIVLLICLILLGLAVWFGSGVRFNNSFNAYFDEDDPAYTGFLDFRDEFGSDEISYVLYAAPHAKHGVWDIEVMRIVGFLTRDPDLKFDSILRNCPFAATFDSFFSLI